MIPEKAAQGVLKQGDFGDSKWYYVQCECSDPDCAHTLEIEADEIEVSVHAYVTAHTKWWEKNRWQQIWQLLTRGYAEMQTTIVLNEQTALNYSEVLKSAIKDVKTFREQRKAKS